MYVTTGSFFVACEYAEMSPCDFDCTKTDFMKWSIESLLLAIQARKTALLDEYRARKHVIESACLGDDFRLV